MRTSTHEWSFDLGGELAVANLNLSLVGREEGEYFVAGLWDADGSWSKPDSSHPLGESRVFGSWHTVYHLKRRMRRTWGLETGRISISTREGHISYIGERAVVTRRNVYCKIVRARSMATWLSLVGEKMILKRRLPSLEDAEAGTEGSSY